MQFLLKMVQILPKRNAQKIILGLELTSLRNFVAEIII